MIPHLLSLILFCRLFFCSLQAESSPLRVVSLTPHVTEIMFAIGAQDSLVGVTNQCNYPAQALKVRRIGNMTEPGFETIVALKPQLVIGSDLTPQSLRDALKKSGISVEISQPNKLPDIATEVRRFGTLLDKKTAADHEAGAIENSIKAFESRGMERRAKGISYALFLAQTEPPIAAAPATWVGDILAKGGFQNVIELDFPPWPRLSHEFLFSRKLNFVFIDGTANAETQTAALWKGALHKPRVVAMPPDILVRPGPRIKLALRLLTELQEKTN